MFVYQGFKVIGKLKHIINVYNNIPCSLLHEVAFGSYGKVGNYRADYNHKHCKADKYNCEKCGNIFGKYTFEQTYSPLG